MTITPDSQAMLLLCSRLGLSVDPAYMPLTLKDWNPLAKKMLAQSMRPEDLLGMTCEDINSKLEVGDEESERIARLLQRTGSLAIELERLESVGIFPLTRADGDYPAKYRQRLKESAPTVLFYAGEKALLGQPGIAVVGSRNLDEAGKECAEFIGNACGYSGMVLYSGGAKGVDTISMNAAIGARGTSVGILAASLEKAIKDPENRAAIREKNMCLATPYSPNAPFSVGTAMGRNKLIYTLADYAIVVASDFQKGGTWAGATEALKAKWLPVFVLTHDKMPEGNAQLLQKGALEFPHPFNKDLLELQGWLEEKASRIPRELEQPSLF